MANLSQLKLIVGLREEAEGKAAKMMQQAQASLEQHQHQLQTLRSYRNDYLTKMSDHSKLGLSAQQYAQYQDFVTRLDDALGRAEQATALAKRAWLQRQTAWLTCRSDTQAIEALIDRELAVLQLKTQRQEQKQLDELASNRFYRQSHR